MSRKSWRKCRQASYRWLIDWLIWPLVWLWLGRSIDRLIDWSIDWHKWYIFAFSLLAGVLCGLSCRECTRLQPEHHKYLPRIQLGARDVEPHDARIEFSVAGAEKGPFDSLSKFLGNGTPFGRADAPIDGKGVEFIWFSCGRTTASLANFGQEGRFRVTSSQPGLRFHSFVLSIHRLIDWLHRF